jgi:hypothetical protein
MQTRVVTDGHDVQSKREHAAARAAAGVLRVWHSTQTQARRPPSALLLPALIAAAVAEDERENLPGPEDPPVPSPVVTMTPSDWPAAWRAALRSLFSEPTTPSSKLTPTPTPCESAADLLLLSGCCPLPHTVAPGHNVGGAAERAIGATEAIGAAGAASASRVESQALMPLKLRATEAGPWADRLDQLSLQPLDLILTPPLGSLGNRRRGWGALSPLVLPGADGYASHEYVTPSTGKRKWTPEAPHPLAEAAGHSERHARRCVDGP